MRYEEGAELDTSEVQDIRGDGFGGFGGRGVAFGGGGLGLVGVVIHVLVQALGGDGGTGSARGVEGPVDVVPGDLADGDHIQRTLGGEQVHPGPFTHGTSAQRGKWFTTGSQGGDPGQCDTFSASDLG